jgi:hypothetical protein
VQVRAKLNGRTYRPAGAIFAVDGTAYPGAPGIPAPGAGFSSDLIYGLINLADGLWASQFIGYPAVTYPMGPSVQRGRAKPHRGDQILCRAVLRNPWHIPGFGDPAHRIFPGRNGCRSGLAARHPGCQRRTQPSAAKYTAYLELWRSDALPGHSERQQACGAATSAKTERAGHGRYRRQA